MLKFLFSFVAGWLMVMMFYPVPFLLLLLLFIAGYVVGFFLYSIIMMNDSTNISDF